MKPLLIPERTRNLLREEVNFDDLSHNWAVETFCTFGNSVTILISAFTGRQNEGLLILSRLSRPVSNQLIDPDTKSDFSTISPGSKAWSLSDEVLLAWPGTAICSRVPISAFTLLHSSQLSVLPHNTRQFSY